MKHLEKSSVVRCLLLIRRSTLSSCKSSRSADASFACRFRPNDRFVESMQLQYAQHRESAARVWCSFQVQVGDEVEAEFLYRNSTISNDGSRRT